MSNINVTSPADYSMATSLANANAILNEIMPEITKLNEALTGNVLNADHTTSCQCDLEGYARQRRTFNQGLRRLDATHIQ